MNYKKVLKTALLLVPVACLSAQSVAREATATAAECRKAEPARDKDGVPLPPVVGKEGAKDAKSGRADAAVGCPSTGKIND